MIFLSQFLNLEMSSILIMVVEGFFKMLELRRGKLRGGKKGGREREREWERKRKEVKICVCLVLERSSDMISRHG